MPRNFSYSALTLRVKPSGESNREAWFLTAEEGLVRATVFGGAKSRIRSQVAPFHEGKLMIYHDPVKDSRKVSDFDVQSWRPGIRELWERAATAGALAETVLFSHGGGGNWPEALKLAGASLDALNAAPAETCSRIAIYFFWHWAQILGAKPDLFHCTSCQKEIKQEEFLWYSNRKEAVFCEKCAQNPDSLLSIGPKGRFMLMEIESLHPPSLETLEKWPLDTIAMEQAKALSQAVLAGALGRRLTTWDGI